MDTPTTTPQNPAATNNAVARPGEEEKNITDNVLARIKMIQESGDIKFPKDYVPANALRNAFLVLTDMVDKNNNPVLKTCTQTSIANALFKMVIQGMSPVKNQCYFIPYGDKLTYQRSYFGSIALAKRVSGVKDIQANVIYKEDVFEYEIDTETGKTRVLKHDQKLANIDIGKISGAYATVINEDGTKETTIMTYPQIVKAWQQGAMKGNSGAHNNFTDEMCKKTVINRACKDKINTSNDSDLFEEDEEKPVENTTKSKVETEINDNSNNQAEPISFEEMDKKEEQQQQQTNAEAKIEPVNNQTAGTQGKIQDFE